MEFNVPQSQQVLCFNSTAPLVGKALLIVSFIDMKEFYIASIAVEDFAKRFSKFSTDFSVLCILT